MASTFSYKLHNSIMSGSSMRISGSKRLRMSKRRKKLSIHFKNGYQLDYNTYTAQYFLK